ncbi:TetR/AcrR family transcriptional regulator [Bifidobacterium pullorum subsp. saeculare]|uniref:TetR/AcrR family transcriptional regulator n=2 Tax=Bifidobacterium pullorum TaxID=78448 RepID=A0A938WWZ6_9BIFI|nr:TetR/AcrR family transcriptional regulator [Bifidobacterium pullorum subsp. saeculare]
MATVKGDARRAAIVRAAYEISLETGFAKVTVSDIAERVGMTRSLFYHYFPDKEAVADAVLEEVSGRILAKLQAWDSVRETGNIRKALADIVRLTRSLIADESPFSSRMLAGGNAELYLKFVARISDRIASLLERTTVRDFERLHGMPIAHVHETLVLLISGLIALIRSHPDIPDSTLSALVTQTLHLDNYLDAPGAAAPATP